ncbi:hypothetical protein CC86DRAFT_18676 [Ophiobolus disseminans]|uniref:Uncharacterized protein n=1 Tax=Ophiobolus disseminans TaxID=1469910 RepID=A0A6A7A1Z2_9PLEO|nr:hypothetical protein CC86DRAFT_18676 [Ophiobolus disseminans]
MVLKWLPTHKPRLSPLSCAMMQARLRARGCESAGSGIDKPCCVMQLQDLVSFCPSVPQFWRFRIDVDLMLGNRDKQSC